MLLTLTNSNVPLNILHTTNEKKLKTKSHNQSHYQTGTTKLFSVFN